MNLNLDWVPLKWPGGPLEISNRAKAQSLTVGVREMLEAWHDPARLDLVRGTPVNCLVVRWAEGQPEDLAQQTSLAPLIKAGREIGISFVGEVSGNGTEDGAISAGLHAGLSAVLLDEPPKEPSALPVILRSPRSKLSWKSSFPLLTITENRWPGIGTPATRGADAVTGPTGALWVDSNGWFSLLAHQLENGKAFWLDIDPPDSTPSWYSPTYCMTLADCQAYGSRWVISLDDRSRLGLIKKDAAATSLWQRVVAAASFFKKHEEWQRFHPAGVLAVTSDFQGENESLAGEVLNLLSRRHVQYKIIERSRLSAASLEGLKAIAWVDAAGPNPESRSKLLAFLNRGGFLVASSAWRLTEGSIEAGDFSDRYELRAVGRGRVAIARLEFRDPYQAAVDIHLLTSRRNDLVRLYNAGTTNCYCSVDPESPRGLVQILNYSASGPANFVTLWLRTNNPAARIWALGAKQPTSILGNSSNEGVEFNLPDIPVYLALEFNNEVLR